MRSMCYFKRLGAVQRISGAPEVGGNPPHFQDVNCRNVKGRGQRRDGLRQEKLSLLKATQGKVRVRMSLCAFSS